MTSTIGTPAALIDASLLPGREWCEVSGNYHRDSDEDGSEFGPVREHVIEFGNVVASTDQPAPGNPDQPYAFVCVTMQEKSYYDHLTDDDPKVALAEASFPHFTPAEARQLAETLLAAADRAEEIAEERASARAAA